MHIAEGRVNDWRIRRVCVTCLSIVLVSNVMGEGIALL